MKASRRNLRNAEAKAAKRAEYAKRPKGVQTNLTLPDDYKAALAAHFKGDE